MLLKILIFLYVYVLFDMFSCLCELCFIFHFTVAMVLFNYMFVTHHICSHHVFVLHVQIYLLVEWFNTCHFQAPVLCISFISYF